MRTSPNQVPPRFWRGWQFYFELFSLKRKTPGIHISPLILDSENRETKVTMVALGNPMGVPASLEKQKKATDPQREPDWVPNAPFVADLFKHVQNDPHAILFVDETKDLVVTRKKMLLDILSVGAQPPARHIRRQSCRSRRRLE